LAIGPFLAAESEKNQKMTQKLSTGNWPSMNVENGQSGNGEWKWTRKMANWKGKMERRKVGENE
jgi:hypothetical protein